MSDPIQQFREALRGRGIVPPDEIKADGRIHRADVEGKNGKGDASYLFHADSVPAGGIENHRDGAGWQNWRADIGRPLSSTEKSEIQARNERARAEREADEAKRHAEARAVCAHTWNKAKPVTPENPHPYLARKAVQAHGLKVTGSGRLLIPMRDTSGALHSLQFIDPDGTKRFKTGGRKHGCYFSIGKKMNGVLCLAEGYATAASIHESTGCAVAVAFDAGNLKPVALALREKFPDVKIVVCADDDYMTERNSGLTKATEAARAVDGWLAVPDFGQNRPEDATDFNDLHQARGADAVKRCIEAASEPGKEESTPGADGSSPGEDPTPSIESPDATPAESPDEIVIRLAKLSTVDYERERKDAAKRLGMRASALDQVVQQERQGIEAGGIAFDEVEPWPEPVDAAALLSDIARAIQRFIICKPETAQAAALWTAMTWFMDAVQIAPLAVITAPEKRCGKSQLLTILGKLSNRPMFAANVTPAALFRVIDAWQPSLMIDEADAFMKENEELRGIINSGHTRDSAYVVRVVGDDHTPKQFSTWGAKAIAGIGHLADTLMDRAIILDLRRKLPHEQVERLRHAEPGLFHDLASMLCRFSNDNREAIRRARPNLPPALHDRAQDNWEPLLAIADVAGGAWPELARKAALIISGGEGEAATIGEELLADIQEVFETKRIERIGTNELIEALCADDEKPWATYNRGKRITSRQLSKRLGDYNIKPKTIRVNPYETPKGYDKTQFLDAFSRYLSVPPILSATTPQSSNGKENPVADNPQRGGEKNQSATLKPAPILDCGGVADKNGGSGGDEIIEEEI